MSPKDLHSWDLSPEAAVQVQAGLRQRLILVWDGRPVSAIGGVDVSFKESHACAAIVILRFPDLMPLEGITAVAPLAFPYIPGLLAFREGPAFLAAWERLRVKPDLLMFDGQGIAHPRGIGIAAHMGLWVDRPSIGVAKSRLYGKHAEPGLDRGDRALLYDEHDRERAIGAVLRTREKVKPLYISPGHLIDIEHSVAFVLGCVTRYRLPEPTRWAHQIAGGEKLPCGPEAPTAAR
jgi:deoxyribonuclease V